MQQDTSAQPSASRTTSSYCVSNPPMNRWAIVIRPLSRTGGKTFWAKQDAMAVRKRRGNQNDD